jgi:hypothetical protein
MKFTERKEWHYDTEKCALADVQTALKIFDEYICRFSPKPYPTFYEVDRQSARYDVIWHVSLDERTVFSRALEIPALIQTERPDWRLTKLGLVPQQKHKVWLSNLALQRADWFPVRGDLMYFNGYRNLILNVVLDPSVFWQQTNIWLGLVLETIIPPDGDARPVVNPGVLEPAEKSPGKILPEYAG